MDVNGTRFHLVLGKGDWFPQASTCPPGTDAPDGRPCAEWDPDTATVGLTELPVTFPARKLEAPPEDEDRRGAGADRFGNWYWIGEDGRSIDARSHRDSAPVDFWPHAAAEPAPPEPEEGEFAPVDPPPPPEPPRLQGLAVTTEHYLVAGNLDEPGLLVFDLASGGPPVALRWPEGVPFEPWDICAAPDGGVWLLDHEHARLWSLDRLFRVRQAAPSPAEIVREPDFTPVEEPEEDETATPEPREGPVTLDASLDLSSVLDPIAVEVLCDGSALVLGRDGTGPVLHRFTLEEGETHVLPLAPLLYAYPDVLAELPRGHEFAFVPAEGCSTDSMAGRVFIVTPDGNQSFAFTLSGSVDELAVDFERAFYPMRRFGGRALVAHAGEARYDSGDRWVSLLEYPRPNFAREAVLTLPVRGVEAEPGAQPVQAFDGREPGCVWHRLFLDACIPPESSVLVESRAADTAQALEAMEWTAEPAPYLRAMGPELPFRATYPPGPAGQAGSWELLFQNAVGRWLQLRITLKGNGRITPRIRAVRAYYPRFSYLREYLPAVWREDTGSAWFLDRYLANVEGTFTEVEERIAAAQVLFDTDTVPPEFLDWLAGWMGAALDASWSEEKKRFFLSHAMEMFAGRGTRDGMIRALRLALEDCADPHLFDAAADAVTALPASATSTSSSSSTTTVTKAAGKCGCGCGGSGGCGGGSATGSTSARFTVRVVESFLTRGAAGVAYGDVGSLTGPGTTTTALEWSPAQGPEPLHARWREWLSTQYADIDALEEAWGITTSSSTDGTSTGIAPVDPLSFAPGFGITLPALTVAPAEDVDYTGFDDTRLKLPVTAPSNATKKADWERFLAEGLGFTWAIPDSQGDLTLWRDFLARRYRQPADLNRAWALPQESAWTSFDAVAYPTSLPENRTALGDWITFVSVVVPMRRGAHRFTVLVPVAPEDDRETQRKRRELARRIALLEKPAHTVLETRLYWAAFRVGEARLGTDTLLGQGSRFTALLLDRGELADSYLGWTEPWNVRGRLVVGRDPVAAPAQTTGTSQRWT